MSPERLYGADAAPPHDVFAAGVMLYELLTGQRAFLTERTVTTLDAEIAPVSSLVDDLPADIADLTHAMLSLAPRVRPTAAVARDVLRSASNAWLQWTRDQCADELRAVAPRAVERESALVQIDDDVR